MRDLHNNTQAKRVLSPLSVADDTAQVGEIIDRQGYDMVEFLIAIGSIGDANATFAVLLEESDNANMSSQNAVADADLLGTEATAGFQFDDDNEVRKLGYIGNKRYLRMTITPSGNGSAALFSAMALLSKASNAPVTQASA